jgi:hypothetical protein
MLDATPAQQASSLVTAVDQLDRLDTKLHQLQQLMRLYADAAGVKRDDMLAVSAESLGSTMNFFADQRDRRRDWLPVNPSKPSTSSPPMI